MKTELNEYGVRDFDYFSLIRKSDNKEVYTSSCYFIGNSGVLDREKINKTLNFYFERINSSIDQQLQSPRLNDEQKSQLKKIEKKNYTVKFKKFMPVGMNEPVYWEKEAEVFLG